MDSLKVGPWSLEKSAPSVGSAIARMEQQRGFRNLTEQELEEEISRGDNAPAEDEVMSEEDDEKDAATRMQELGKAKEKILAGIGQAHMEVATSRDLVSLLLTATRERAVVTLAQHIKDKVPLGSLSREVFEPRRPDPSRADDTLQWEQDQIHADNVAAGIKFRSLNSSADTILASAKRLEAEMKKEAQYWEDVIKVKNDGWIISRMSQDRRALGVRLSALESAPEYRRKGEIKIVRNEDGKAELDLHDDLADGKRLRVEIRSQGKIVAAVRGEQKDPDAMEEESLSVDLRRARDSLFDLELFHELSRESGTLWNRGVKYTDQGIILPLSSDEDIILSLAAPGDFGDPTKYDEHSSQLYQRIVDCMAPILRILLSYGFRQAYNKRTAPPPPLTQKKPGRMVHNILEPLLDRTQHQILARSLGSFIENLLSLLKRAQFKANLERPQDDMGLSQVLSKSGVSSRPVAEAVVHRLSHPGHSKYLFQIDESGATLKIMFRITKAGPEFRYELVDVKEDSQLAKEPQNMTLYNQVDFQNAILHLVELRLVELLHSKLNQEKWKLSFPHTGEIRSVPDRDITDPKSRVELIRLDLSSKLLSAVWKRSSPDDSVLERKWEAKLADGSDVDIIAEVVKADNEGS